MQTTTTIGYGDLVQPFNQRWFQIFYLILSTYFVGNTLGGLASLRSELEQVRRNTAWGRREVNKGLIDEMQPEDNDGKIDQYEFLVASLLHLGKISSSDVEPIMDKVCYALLIATIISNSRWYSRSFSFFSSFGSWQVAKAL